MGVDEGTGRGGSVGCAALSVGALGCSGMLIVRKRALKFSAGPPRTCESVVDCSCWAATPAPVAVPNEVVSAETGAAGASGFAAGGWRDGSRSGDEEAERDASSMLVSVGGCVWGWVRLLELRALA